MKKLIGFFAIIIFFLFISVNAYSQQWTAEQQEVWTAVQTYNDVASKRDIGGFLSYFDESYKGWSYESDMPLGKDAVNKSIGYWFNNSKSIFNILTPVGIWVKGNFAFVHYYFSSLYEDKDGKPHIEKGRWTDILMKKDGKWVMVGDHGGGETEE